MISVLIPFAGNCEWRLQGLAWTRARYEELGWEVVVGQGDPNEWRKADAVEDALDRAKGDLLVVADADCWSDDLPRAVEAVERGAKWSVPFQRVHRFTRNSTENIYAGLVEPHSTLDRIRPPYRGVMGGGLLVLPRDLYEQIPLDRRFIRWGGEDDSWGWALRTLVGEPIRFDAHLWHLWHPSAAPKNATHDNPANNALAGRYRDAWSHRDEMRLIVEEARCQSRTSSSRR